MPLTQVTITGADDKVDPQAMVELSAEFPFVEWGILSSITRAGSRRYPSVPWNERLLTTTAAVSGKPRMALALHLCGNDARQITHGKVVEMVDYLDHFDRVQINGYTEIGWRFVDVLLATTPIYILQVRTNSLPESPEMKQAVDDARRINLLGYRLGARERAHILYDPSGGTGRPINFFPHPPQFIRVGYAGGIKPETITEIPAALRKFRAPWWLDMESGVRDAEDRFDLGLVRQALENVRPYVEEVT